MSNSQIVIIGGGIIGVCTAFYLLRSKDLPENTQVTLIENTAIASAASSKAAGFIGGGPNWHGEGNRDLARLSFEAFTQLAEEFDGERSFGWRNCGAAGYKIGYGQDELSSYRKLPITGEVELNSWDWVNGERTALSREGGVAQLEPGEFCHCIHTAATKLGLKTVIAEPVKRTDNVLVTSEGDFAFDKLLICAGPWSADLCDTLSLPRVPVGSLPGHSILLRPAPTSTPVPAEALMCGVGITEDKSRSTPGPLSLGQPLVQLAEEELMKGWTRTLEMFPRPNGLIYAAGENSIPPGIGDKVIDERENHFPLSAKDVGRLINTSLIERMLRSAKAVSDVFDVTKEATLVKADLCYRPVTKDKMPILGRWQGDVFVASGHGPWGITLAPGTGMVMADWLISDILGTPLNLPADVSGLSPFRFDS